MQVDVIVNTANEEPIYSSGTDTAVYLAAGEEELLKARKEIGYDSKIKSELYNIIYNLQFVIMNS